MKLLSKLPDDRFQNSQQVADLLDGCVAHVQYPTTTPLPESVEQLSQLPPSTQRGGSGRKQWRQRFTIGFGAFAMVVADILIVIETNKGTLTIESEANDVPIRIVQGRKLLND